MTETVLILMGIVLLAAITIVAVVKKLVCICQPNEVLIFSGARRRVGDKEVGYRLVHGGRALRIPLLEKVTRMDLTNTNIQLRVENAYSRGGIPLTVEGVANVKVASEQPFIGNAIERFAKRNKHDIARVARETLEGNLRGVLATLTPEEVNQDRVKFAQSLLQEADADLKALGLMLDTLKIQSVTDEKGYLDSIGRKQSAELTMRSRVAEAENAALAAERSAQNLETKEVARLEADLQVARAEAERRMTDADGRGAAMVAEQRAHVGALMAKAKAEVAVQRERIEQVKLQLEADRIRPAEAERQALVAKAQADTATILEEGKATAASLRAMMQTWSTAGEDARRAFVAQRLKPFVTTLLNSAPLDQIDRVAVVPASSGKNLAGDTIRTSESVKAALGIDVPMVMNQLAARAAS